MTTYTEQTLGVQIHGSDKSVRNLRMEDVVLDEFVLGPVDDVLHDYSLENSQFKRLRIARAFLVYEGVQLEDIVFEDIACSDALTISNLAILSRVRFVGNKGGKGLWIKPLDDVVSEAAFVRKAESCTKMRPPEYMVDITEFYGDDVEILGLPINKVRFDSSRHFAIDSRWQEIAWRECGIQKSSFWRMRFERLALYGVETGIFELPTSRYKNYDGAVKDLRALHFKHPGILPVL